MPYISSLCKKEGVSPNVPTKTDSLLDGAISKVADLWSAIKNCLAFMIPERCTYFFTQNPATPKPKPSIIAPPPSKENFEVAAASQVKEALEQLNADYRAKETDCPSQGYRVVFEEEPKLQATLFPMGERRITAALSGVPENPEAYKKNCPFCQSSAKVFQVFQNAQAIISHSNQVLIIPNTHYAHWFEMPLEEQQELLQHALDLRKENKVSSKMELHCGSAGYQTVFHTHFRTGIFTQADHN